MKFVMPLPKSAHRKRNPPQEVWSIKKPDVDNLYKGIADAMEGIVYENDSQISHLVIEKKTAAQGTEAKVMIEVTPAI
jgi:Holliday junction resolvase RusA-like endonuclease